MRGELVASAGWKKKEQVQTMYIQIANRSTQTNANTIVLSWLL